MSKRLPLDSAIVGYWGFDETLETDAAIDESTYGDAHLTVTASPSTQLARVGNGRTFSGSAFATVTNARLRISGDLTLMVWFKLNTLNSGGSFLRCVISCGGPTNTDPQMYGLYVDNQGRLIYKYNSASGDVVVRTGPGVIHTAQLHHVVFTRTSGVPAFFVDNFPIPYADVTIAGSAQVPPLPAPLSAPVSVFHVAQSVDESDLAYWDGVIDEMSVHNVARPYQPYVRAAYFNAALSASTFRISAANTILSVSSSDMGLGIRWWCYERDQSLYVVKESPFGNFGTETLLVTTGSALASQATAPELIYDATSDVLYVFFISGNRVYKLSAASADVPANVNMPLTADTTGIIKSADNVDNYRAGEGYGGQREFLPTDVVYVNRTPIKLNGVDGPYLFGEGDAAFSVPTYVSQVHAPAVAFVTSAPYGFGVMIQVPDAQQTGLFAAYYITGGALVSMATPIRLDSGMYFAPIATRVYQRRYVIEVLTPVSKQHTGVFSEVLEDRLFEPLMLNGTRYVIGPGWDGNDSMLASEGYGGQREFLPTDIVVVNKTPLKLSYQELTIPVMTEGYGGQAGSITQSAKTVML